MPKPRTETGGKNLIGPRFKILRENKTWSQWDLAHQFQLIGIDIDKNVITRIETNKRYVTDFEIRAIAKLFGVSYQYLIDGEE